MKKRYLALFTLLGFILQAKAQVPKEKALLWEVSGKGITKPSYLFGTIHLMCPTQMNVPQVVKDKFNATNQLFLEIDMDDPNMMQEIITGMQMKDSSTLESLLGNNYDSVSTAFQKATGMPLKLLNNAKPFLLISMIYPSLLGCTPISWESVFQEMAKEKGVAIGGLEKLEDQMNVFEKIPYKVQADMLVKTLFNLDSSKQDFDKMMEVYLQQDIDKLNELTAKADDYREYEAILLNDRNHNWIPVIGEQAKKEPTFFAFGAGHMGGQNGVINLLRKAGFAVKPVYTK